MASFQPFPDYVFFPKNKIKNKKMHKSISLETKDTSDESDYEKNPKKQVSFNENLVQIINVESYKKYNDNMAKYNPIYIKKLSKRKGEYNICLIF